MKKSAKTHHNSGNVINDSGIIMLNDISQFSDNPSENYIHTDDITHTKHIRTFNKKKIITLSVIIGIILILIATVSIIIVCYNNKINSVIEKDTFYDGIVVEGIALGGKTIDEAKEVLAKLEPQLRDEVDITVTYGDKVYSFTEDDFEFTYDTEKVLIEAYAVGRHGSKKERYNKVLDLKENPLNYTITAQISDSTVPKIVEDIKGDINYDAIESHVSKFVPFASDEGKFTFTEGSNGIAINEESLTSSLIALINGKVKKGTVEVTASEIPYTYSVNDIREKTKFLCTFSTVSTNTKDGNHNMALALSKINGTILKPGEVFSFCSATGNSNNGSLGYVEAGVISKGKLIQGFGGGICQASSTLYGAVIRADLTIISRSNHSWPSTYVPIGLDAAINYPGTDFQFRNDTSFPIFIEAAMNDKKLTVNIYGCPSNEWDEIRVTSTKTSTTEPEKPTYINDPSLPKGVTSVERSAHTGHTASAEKIYYKNGTEVKREALPNSSYKAISAIIKVGTGAASKKATPQTSSQTTSSQASSSTPSPTPSQPSSSSEAPAVSSQPTQSEASQSSSAPAQENLSETTTE